MKSGLCLAVLFAGLCSTAAFAQGGAPYNSSGSQAGGPLAGQERRMDAPGGSPAGSMAKPMRKKPVMRRKRMKRGM